MSWKYVEAGELMAKRGGTVDPSKFPDEVFELHSIPAFDAGRPEIVPGREIGSAKQLVQADDVMISKIVPHIRRASVVGAFSEHRQIGSGEWIIFRDSRFFPAYLRHFLMSDDFNGKFMATVSGVGGSLLRARPAEVAKIKIPLPPMEEQRRIAAILDKADALRVKRQEVMAKLEQLLQSVFMDIFGDPVLNPKKWEMVQIERLADQLRDGPFGSNLKSEHYTQSGVRVIRLQNIGVWKFNFEDVVYISEDHFESLVRNHCFPGDVLIGTLGEPNLRACIFPQELNRGLNKADCLLFRTNRAVATPEYVCGLINCRSLIDSASGLALGQTRLRVSMGRLKELIVPLPPIALQRRFSEFVQKYELMYSRGVRLRMQTEHLFRSIQGDFFG